MRSTKGILHVTWFVTTPSKDIADFYVNIRDGKSKVLVEHHLAYDTRVVDIRGDAISSDYQNGLQVCVLAKNSDGTIGSWFDSQCFDLPSDFESVKRKYSQGYHAVYEILSSKKSRKSVGRGGASSKGCVVSASAVSMMLLLLVSAITTMINSV